MKKKMISLVLAATMLLGASMTVFAADAVTSTGGADITIDSKIEAPTIKVTITQGGEVVANPYALESRSIDANADGTYPTLGGTYIEFENGGNTAISIGLTGKIVLATYENSVATADKVTVASSLSSVTTAKTKQVYIQAEVTADEDGTEQFYKSDSSTAAEKALVYTTSGAKLSNAPVLAASGEAGTNQSDTMYVQITGATSLSPTSAWSDADKFSVVTTYDIQLSSAASLSTFKAAATTS